MRTYLRDGTFPPDQLDAALRRTIPTIFNIGSFEVGCFGIRRIGYSDALEKALHASTTLYYPLPNAASHEPLPLAPRTKNSKRSGDHVDLVHSDDCSHVIASSGPSSKRRRRNSSVEDES